LARLSPFESCFNDANKEANVHMNTNVATGHADVEIPNAYDDDNDNDNDNANANDGGFADSLGEILGVSSIALPVLDIDNAFGAVDSTVNFDRKPPPFFF